MAATATRLLQLAGVGLDVAAAHIQQPDADPDAPGTKVSQVGPVGGARAVTVAEEESGDQGITSQPRFVREVAASLSSGTSVGTFAEQWQLR